MIFAAGAAVLTLGCNDGRPPGPGERSALPEPAAVETPEQVRLEIDNTSEHPVTIRFGNGRVALSLAPFEIGSLELPADERVELFVADGESLRLPNAGLGIVIPAQRGDVQYVWDLAGRGRYGIAPVRGGVLVGSLIPPAPVERFERLGVTQFRAAHGLLDDPAAIVATPGRAEPRKVYRLLAASDGEIPSMPAVQLDAVMFGQPQAYLPLEQAALVPRVREAWPDDYAHRLLDLLERDVRVLSQAVAKLLGTEPDPSLARAVRQRLVELGPKTVPAPTRRALTRILAACGTASDLDAAWRASTNPVARQHMLAALADQEGPSVTDFFMRRLVADDEHLAGTAWEYLLRPNVLRDPMVLAMCQLQLDGAWYLAHEDRQRSYRRLLEAAVEAWQRRAPYPDALVDWLLLEALHRLDQEKTRLAIGYFSDKGAPGIAILHAAYPRLPLTKRRDLIARPLIDQHDLYPELLALLLDAVHDAEWDDVARPALRRMVRDEQMLDESFRAMLHERVGEIASPSSRQRAFALFQEGWRAWLMTVEPKELGMDDEHRKAELLGLIQHGADAFVARQAYESLWSLLAPPDRATLLADLFAGYERAGGDNRVVLLFTLLDHVRLARDHGRDAWVDPDAVLTLAVSALQDEHPGVREVAFGTLTQDAHWFADERVRSALEAAARRESIRAQAERFRRSLLIRNAHDAGRRAGSGDRLAAEFLGSLLRSDDEAVATAALDAMLAADSPHTIDLLALQYPSFTPAKRERALLGLAGTRTMAFDVFRYATTSSDPHERRMAFRAGIHRLRRTADDRLEWMLMGMLEAEADADLLERFLDWRRELEPAAAERTLPRWTGR